MDSKVWMGVQRSKFFTDEEKSSVSSLISRYRITGPINESILSKMRGDLANMAKDEKSLIDERALDKLMDIMSSSSKFSAYLADLLAKSWDKILAYYKGSFDAAKSEFLNMVNSGNYDFPRATLDKEFGEANKLIIFWLKDMKRNICGEIRSKYAKCLLAESMENSADTMVLVRNFDPNKLNEGKDPWSFLDKIASAISETEPFKTIRKVSELNKTFNNTSINKFSILTKELNGPDCGKFTSIGSIANKLDELRPKTFSLDGLLGGEPMLRFLPDYKSMVEMFDLLAAMICSVELIPDLKK